MSRVDVLSLLYTKRRTISEFNYDKLTAKPLLSYITVQDIEALHKIATSVRLSSKPKEKYKMIDNILVPRGFKKLASGTNRVVYKCLNDQSVVLKVAYDEVALSDNPSEYRNQFLLKPFCAKMFEVSPCGTVALQERVQPITTREEYMQIAPDVFNLLVNKILGKFVLDDIGSKYFQNIGLRLNFGPVLLDYPYVYELDGEKLHCLEKEFDGSICDGDIDYDSGFNRLLCNKCGKQYFAWQLEKLKDENGIVTAKGENEDMSILIMQGDEVVNKIESNRATDSIKKPSDLATKITTERERMRRNYHVGEFNPVIRICGEDESQTPKYVAEKVEPKVEIDSYTRAANKVEEANANMTSHSLKTDLDQNVFGSTEHHESVCSTSLGDVLSNVLDSDPTVEDSLQAQCPDTEEEPVDTITPYTEYAEEVPEQEEEPVEEVDEAPDPSELAVIIEPNDEYDEETGVIRVSSVKPIKPEEVQETLDTIQAQCAEEESFTEAEDLSSAY